MPSPKNVLLDRKEFRKLVDGKVVERPGCRIEFQDISLAEMLYEIGAVIEELDDKEEPKP